MRKWDDDVDAIRESIIEGRDSTWALDFEKTVSLGNGVCITFSKAGSRIV